MQRVAIIDADLIGKKKHRFPNLACMKLSGYYKELGNEVTLVTNYTDLFSTYIELSINEEPKFEFLLFDDSTKGVIKYYCEKDIIYDKIIISKVFTDTPVPIQIKALDIVEYGGTGFYYDKAIPLPYEIEHHMPDYHLYDEWVYKQINKGKKQKEFEYYMDYSIGFTTRGCFRKCSFCVNQKYSKVEFNAHINEFLDPSRKYICLLDDNILGYSYWETIINELTMTNKYFQYKQGLDMRLMTVDKAKKLSNIKYKGDYIFAFDDINEKEIIENRLKIWRKYNKKSTKFYVLCAYKSQDINDIIETFERIKILMKYKCLPYLMRFKEYENSKYKGIYIALASWCNQPQFFKKKSFKEWCYADAKRRVNKTCASLKSLLDFEILYKDISDKYFNLRYDEFSNAIEEINSR